MIELRVALISDIHGNLSALDSVLEQIDATGVDLTVCLGDVSASGPSPRETLERLRLRNIPIIMGNKDELLLAPPPENIQENANGHDRGRHTENDASRIREIDLWCVSKLRENDRKFIRTFRRTMSVSSDDRSASLFCFHGSPKSYTDLITSKTPDGDLGAMLSGFECRTMVGGHSHVQMLRKFGKVTLLNPGSVGQAIERSQASDQVRRVPWSEYAVATIGNNGFLSRIDFVRGELDIPEIYEEAMKSGMPHPEWWADRK